MSNARIKKLIRESNLIEGIDDTKEDEQSLLAWNILNDNWLTKLNHGAIVKTQKVITLNQTDLQPHQRGYYRSMSKVNVQVGDHVPPVYSMVDGLMDNWLLDYEELGAWKAHQRFEYIHPFVDGNGRTGRMLMWWQEVREGKEPTLIRAHDRQSYYKALGESQTNNGE